MKKIFSLLLVLALLACSAVSLAGAPATPDEAVEEAVAQYSVVNAVDAYHEDGDVLIPHPVIFRIDYPDDTHAVVYGNFWCFYYRVVDNVLLCISGGSAPGVMELELGENGWTVSKVTYAECGEDFGDSIRDLCKGDEALADQYFESEDLSSEPAKTAREKHLLAYVKANNLPVDSYQDEFWPVEKLPEE